MGTLSASHWKGYLARISQRYEGHSITLRRKEPDEEQAHVVLWRTPLRHLSADANTPGTEVVIQAGYEEPFIEVYAGPVQHITVEFGTEESLKWLRIFSEYGIVLTLVLNLEE